MNDAIVIMCNLPWDWPTDYSVQTARVLNGTHLVGCYRGVEPILPREMFRRLLTRRLRTVERREGILTYRPLFLLPGNRFSLIRSANHAVNIWWFMHWILRPGKRRCVLWFFDPFLYPLRRYFPVRSAAIYDCVDYVSDDAGNRTPEILRQEESLIRECDVMTVNSRALYGLHKRVRRDIRIVPLGFRYRQYAALPPASRHRPPGPPVIAVVGSMDRRIRYPLLFGLAVRHPEWMFEITGPVAGPVRKHMDRLCSLPNVTHSVAGSQSEVAAAIQRARVCLIPYDRHIPFVAYSFPMKVMEYFWWGKPVVASDIIELRHYPGYIRIASTLVGWESAITDWLSAPPARRHKLRMRAIAVSHAWERKVWCVYNALGRV